MKYLLLVLVLVPLYLILFRRGEGSATSDEFLTGVVGHVGTAEETFTTNGTVAVRGEIWNATSRRGIIQKGAPVRVVAMKEGLVLEVEALEA